MPTRSCSKPGNPVRRFQPEEVNDFICDEILFPPAGTPPAGGVFSPAILLEEKEVCHALSGYSHREPQQALRSPGGCRECDPGCGAGGDLRHFGADRVGQIHSGPSPVGPASTDTRACHRPRMDPLRQGLALRQRIGYTPEQGAFYPWMRGEEVLRLLAQTRRLSLPEEVTDLAHQFGLDLSRPFGTYTPGQRKILFLIHAFVFPADVLILDEPTAGLETTAQDVVYRLARQARAEGRTVFFTTSSLLEAERLCDRVALLWQGRVLAVERGVQLRAKPCAGLRCALPRR